MSAALQLGTVVHRNRTAIHRALLDVVFAFNVHVDWRLEIALIVAVAARLLGCQYAEALWPH